MNIGQLYDETRPGGGRGTAGETPRDHSKNFHSARIIRGMVVALNADTGKEIWKTYAIEEEPKLTAAATVIPGVVFAAGLDGMLRALSTTFRA
jgi:outer membrane protein assembly factor BamB